MPAHFSLLNCLCAAIPARERVITCEEVFELSMHATDVAWRPGDLPRWWTCPVRPRGWTECPHCGAMVDRMALHGRWHVQLVGSSEPLLADSNKTSGHRNSFFSRRGGIDNLLSIAMPQA